MYKCTIFISLGCEHNVAYWRRLNREEEKKISKLAEEKKRLEDEVSFKTIQIYFHV